jgi:hypothetical protein
MGKNPAIDDREKLARKGLMILTPIHNTFYNVNVSKEFDINDEFVRSLVQDIYLPKAQDEVMPDVWSEKYEKFIVNAL